MNNLKIEATESTPYIKCDPVENKIEIKGRSIPENATSFYSPLIDWIEEYKNNGSRKARLEFYLDYINSISQKIILDILNRFDEFKHEGKDVKVIWKYEQDDEEMEDEGRIFASKVDLDFEMQVLRD